MTSRLRYFLSAILLCLAAGHTHYPTSSLAEVHDPLDPFESKSLAVDGAENDENKTAQELLLEASLLLEDDRPLDARTKLLKALQKDPKEYKAHLMLAAYYMVHVGHFRLALKYVRQAQALFEAANGRPPYQQYLQRSQHAHILYLLSQARLNLDNYQGALDLLDEFTSYGYYDDWYPGTRAWVLMKLGRIEEAIQVARLGALGGAEPGRTLNMLGILLSMIGERQASLSVFKEAIAYELSLGTRGQPATPLNNAGEVYKEIFSEPQAESSWLRATSMPDGCEHVLPSLNLALLYIDELNLAGAKRAMDNFETCVAQYPLRNGEEHRALVHLARGRIALYSGFPVLAVKHLRAALASRQWFGKIGTNEKDLKSGALISLTQALQAENNHLRFRRPSSWHEYLAQLQTRLSNTIYSWWYLRRVRQILIEDLAGVQDLYIRNTDSLIEYPTFGTALAGLPTRLLEQRLSREKRRDNRKEALIYYQLYAAQNYLAHGAKKAAYEHFSYVIDSARPQHDDSLKLQALLGRLSLSRTHTVDYALTAFQVFAMSRAALRNHGLRLPVNLACEVPEAGRELARSAFIPDNNRPLEYSINCRYKDGEYALEFSAAGGGVGSIKVKSRDLRQAVNKLADLVFTQELT